jgi:hypothetical protein
MVVAFPQDTRLTALLSFGILMGIVLFFKGFRVYREYRIEEDTPEIPIRSVAMGLIHVHGEARPGSDGLMSSPVGRTPCLFYKVDIDHWEGSGDRGNWQRWKSTWGGTPFVLADSTGQVTIDGHGAEMMVGQNTQAVAGGAAGFSSLEDDPYAPPDPYATPDPYAPQASPAATATATPVLGVPKDSELVEFAEMAPGGGLGGATGYYRLTEYVILAGWSYDVIGTYMDNPDSTEELDCAAAQKDPNYSPPARPAGAATDRKVIRKGKNEKTFVISDADQKATQASLRYRASAQVFGGAALAIGCLALLLNQLGLL